MYRRISNCYTHRGVCTFMTEDNVLHDVELSPLEAKDGDIFCVTYMNARGDTEGIVYIPKERAENIACNPSDILEIEDFENARENALHLMRPLTLTIDVLEFVQLCEKGDISPEARTTLLLLTDRENSSRHVLRQGNFKIQNEEKKNAPKM